LPVRLVDAEIRRFGVAFPIARRNGKSRSAGIPAAVGIRQFRLEGDDGYRRGNVVRRGYPRKVRRPVKQEQILFVEHEGVGGSGIPDIGAGIQIHRVVALGIDEMQLIIYTGIARIRCQNKECGYDYFRPFSCKGFYLCPSCSQKRTLLLSEHFTEEVFLELPHRQFVFTVPKVLRLIFRRNRTLFAKVSRLINQLISDFYSYATGRTIRFGMIAAHQTFGDMLSLEPAFPLHRS
jgi:hypothetical protein